MWGAVPSSRGSTLCFIFLLAFPAVAACVDPARDEGREERERAFRRSTVVALLDSGVNPYHVAFTASPFGVRVDEFLTSFSTEAGPPTLLELSGSGSYRERRGSDDPVWDGVETRRLYAFSNTRLLGISFREPPIRRIIDDSTIGHGTGVASLVSRDDPEAIILMIDVPASYCATSARANCTVDPLMAEGLAWAARQPWIDIISVSAAITANAPDRPELHPEMQQYVEASRRAAANGKIIVNGAGNHVSPALMDYYNGPPWIIAVGGAEPGPKGESTFAAKSPDVMANFTDDVAIAGTLDGYIWASGTSYSTPIVAGALSRALHEVRRTLQHSGGITADGALAAGSTPDGRHLRVTAASLRAALNASAIYFAPTEWDPTNPTAENDTIATVTGVSQPVVIPFAQMGWGYVHAGLAGEIARRVLEEDLGPPPEKAAAAVWMGAVQAAREEFWENWG